MPRATLLSPTRYQRMGFGQALPGDYTISKLRTALIRAQGQVSRYCNVPNAPQAFDWRGGTMTDEKHQWKVVNPLAYGPGAKRVFTNVHPIKAVSALSLDLGKTYTYVLNPATDVYINSIESYVEIVALNPTIIGFWPMAASLGLYNPVAKITYDYGWSFEVVGDVLEAESPTIFSAAYGNWDAAVVPVVYLDGVQQDPDADPVEYTVDYDDGTITFVTAPGVGVEVTVDYTYTVPDEVVQAIGLTATAGLGSARMAQRGMSGLQSLRIAEVSMTAMNPTAWATRNGVSIPVEAASLLDGTYVMASAA